ncbi:ferrous iron transport protein B [Capnocytophaga catalasegens]|uniref:Ferrous iron transport protein B n=1 Tax=Capnocytophaga catalasegens TaxID=1004260 RepID=A0AAV5B023_9FLAO|nr:ferrous iron transport protein B [Capnocytophaga catalasegens]GIZ14320.1 ferrous iron transport protein B [Capnocytophaga catalasegens]GJM51317.1 ferrous iron transport protein B [Capnocytophaga catalasegens]GJM53266.1 ferrous iron transport protein B [Capnocytophaga catalasegens]
MQHHNEIKVALLGNPNTGKTSIFNLLTGLNQRVGNYPGITVDKKIGFCKLSQTHKARIYDLPGTYSLNPSSLDEKIAVENLLDKENIDYPDIVVVVADVENLKQNLLLFTQIKDLQIPTILVLNMADRMQKQGISMNVPVLESLLHTKIVLLSTRQKTGIDQLKSLLIDYHNLPLTPCIDIKQIDTKYFEQLRAKFPQENLYKLWLIITQNYDPVSSIRKKILQDESFVKTESELKRLQQRETILRYQVINTALKQTQVIDINAATGLRARLDRILLHKVWGYVIFVLILLAIFQVIYNVSQYPMDWIEEGFANLGNWLNTILPQGPVSDLLVNGVVAGIGGIVVFVPQIAFLFLFISILEESGYMSRVVFLMDRIMRPFGLSGKSVIPLISGVACAIPAVMATRNIENWKERLIAILVTPFVTCSARLPVYLIIIALVIPDGQFLFFGYKGLTLFLLYVAGVAMAIFSAWILNKTLRSKNTFKYHFIVEMPNYKVPLARNVAVMIYEKTKAFVFGAGKIILAMTVIIWFLETHGYSDAYKNAETHSEKMAEKNNWSDQEKENYLVAYKTENSLLGNIGKIVEPIFAPIGYDWKISIGVLWSFAAREVFVSTMATIYSLGENVNLDNEQAQRGIISRMKAELRPNGTPVYSLATGISILIFYAFAMQCLSTLAIVKKETNSWKYPIIQWVTMTGFAYILALITYQWLK